MYSFCYIILTKSESQDLREGTVGRKKRYGSLEDNLPRVDTICSTKVQCHLYNAKHCNFTIYYENNKNVVISVIMSNFCVTYFCVSFFHLVCRDNNTCAVTLL